MVSVKENTEDVNGIIECNAPILRSLMLTSIKLPKIHLSRSAPDINKLDPQWLLARTIEVGLFKRLLIVGNVSPFFD